MPLIESHYKMLMLHYCILSHLATMQTKELALCSRGRVDGSQSEGPQFDPPVCRKLFMDIVGYGCSGVT